MNYSELKHVAGTTIKKKGLITMLAVLEDELNDSDYFGTVIDINSRGSKAKGTGTKAMKLVVSNVNVKTKGPYAKSLNMWREDWLKQVKELTALVNRDLPKVIVTGQASVKHLYLIMSIFMLRNVMDYTYSLCSAVAIEIHESLVKDTSNDITNSKATYKYLDRAHSDYIASINALTFSDVSKTYKKLPDTTITAETEDMISTGTNGYDFNPGVKVSNGFIGGLIYPVQKLFDDIGILITKRRMSRKRQLEIVRGDIEAELRNNPSPALRAELGVISDEIDTLEYKIKRYTDNL